MNTRSRSYDFTNNPDNVKSRLHRNEKKDIPNKEDILEENKEDETTVVTTQKEKRTFFDMSSIDDAGRIDGLIKTSKSTTNKKKIRSAKGGINRSLKLSVEEKRNISSKGGLKRALSLTPEERSRISKIAANCRWEEQKSLNNELTYRQRRAIKRKEMLAKKAFKILQTEEKALLREKRKAHRVHPC